MTDARPLAPDLLELLGERGWSVATAESLTGGLVSSAIVDVPGASASLRGGIVAYDIRAKHTLLGVDAGLLATRGPVDPDVSRQMAAGAREAFELDGVPVDVGLSTTGVAGPDPADGHAAGTVYVAVATPHAVRARRAIFDGDRSSIRRAAVDAVLALAIETIRE